MEKFKRTTIDVGPVGPIKNVQFGEGIFLRPFAEWMIDASIRMKQVGFHIVWFTPIILCCSSCVKTAPRPNIVLILVDDMGWSDLGCYGSEISTPNLDALAKGGIQYMNAYNTSKCFPSRASLLTGLYAQECGFGTDFRNPLKNALTLGQVLQSAGYSTYWSGKHHGIENPYYLGFDRYYGLRDGASNHFNPGLKRDNEPAPAQKRMRTWCIDSIEMNPYTPPKDFYTTDYFTNYALEYIDEASLEVDPFFLYLSFTAPHDPLMAWPEDIKKYEGTYDSGYHVIRQMRFEKQKELGLIRPTTQLSEFSEKRWENLSRREQEEEVKKMEVYAAMIDRLDQNIGRLIEKLKAQKLLENTLILFMSDNGASDIIVNLQNDNDSSNIGSLDRWVSLGPSWANVSNTPFRYFKNYSYEGGIRTPMIAYWPSQIRNSIDKSSIFHFIDIMPTVIELSGAVYRKSKDGKSIKPMRGESLFDTFENGPRKRENALVFEWEDGQAVRNGDWKLVREGMGSDWELYKIAEDPTETTNLASEFPRTLADLSNEFNQWKETVNK